MCVFLCNALTVLAKNSVRRQGVFREKTRIYSKIGTRLVPPLSAVMLKSRKKTIPSISRHHSFFLSCCLYSPRGLRLTNIMKWHKGRNVLGRIDINDRGGVDTHLGQN